MSPPRLVSGAFLVGLLAVFALLAALIVEPFLTYLLAVFLLAFVLWPVQRRLSPRLGPRLSAFLLVAGAVGASGVSVVLIGLLLPADAAALSRAIERGMAQTRIERWIERTLGTEIPLQSTISDIPRRGVELVIGDLPTILSAATDFFLGVLLVVFLLYYLLKDGDQLVAWITRTMPLRAETTEELTREAHDTTWAVLKGHVAIAVVQGAIAGIGLFVAGLPNVVFWTVVMVFLELLPIVGVAGVLGPAVLYLAFTGRFLAAGFLLIYGITAVAVVDDYLRVLIVDRESSMHSGVILVGVFGGVYAFGVMGLFYGPIVLGLFQTLIRLFDEEYVTRS